MRINVSYERLVFPKLSEMQLADILKFAGKMEVFEGLNGYAVRGNKADMYEMIVNLSYKYDIEIV